MWSSGRSEAALEAALPAPIDVRKLRNARRLRLRFDEASGILKLTCPWRTSRKSALAWALDQRDWIDAQIARALPPEVVLLQKSASPEVKDWLDFRAVAGAAG